MTHAKIRTAILLLAAIVCAWAQNAFAAETPAAPTPENELRVLSFNIWVNGGKSLPETLRIIKDSGADIVGLQEAFDESAFTFAKERGWHAHRDAKYRGGTAVILSRFPIVATSPSQSGVKLKRGENDFIWMFNVHLEPYPYQPYGISGLKRKDAKPTFKTAQEAIDSAWKLRRKKVEATIADILAAKKDGYPVFLTGDFNEPSCQDWTERAAQAGHCVKAVKWPVTAAFIEQAGMIDSYRQQYPDEVAKRGYTWTPRPAKIELHDRIDYVFYNGKNLRLKNAQILGEKSPLSDIGYENYPSDHRAVLATFEITK